MATVLNYKSFERGARSLLVDDDFKSGMQYTDNALEGAYAKMLLNFDYKDDGLCLTPRGGLQTIAEIPFTVGTGAAYYPFLSFTTNVTVLTPGASLKDYRTRCIILAQASSDAVNLPEYAPERKTSLFPNTQLKVFIQDPVTEAFSAVSLDTSDSTQSTISFVSDGYMPSQVIHGMNLQPVGTSKPVFALLNTIGYIVYRQTNGNTLHLGKFIIERNGSTYKYRCEKVAPMSLNPREVVASGYNMLAATPYAFSNSNSGIYSIDGILPYDKEPGVAGRELLLNARQGQSINFEMFYQYKTEANVLLRTKWEWSDSAGDGTWNVIQTEKADNTDNPEASISPDYTAGNAISINFQPTVNQFQLRVSLYRKVSGTIDTKPTKIMVLPLYKLTTENNATTKNIKPITYNLGTATGIMSWKKRMVLWGVTGAENILFTSDINNPSFFPYPNNIDLFDENIIHVTEYLDYMLVFTESRIYMLSLTTDGAGFTTQLLQSRLSIKSTDKHVIQVVKNMVFFKSDNYYYMIVPKANSIKGELIVAPVSKPITNLLDSFEPVLRETLDAVYFRELQADYQVSLINYYNYVDNTIINNVYMLKISPDPDVVIPFPEFTMNVVLNYDTAIRTWSMYAYQCNTVMLPFKQTITDSTVLLDVCTRGTAATAQLIKANTLDPADTFKLNVGERLMKNYQYLDTGYRKQGDQHKKRFREIQIKLNNTSKRSIDFYTEFLIDDQTRNSFYRSEVRHIVDPGNPNYGLIYVEKVIDPTLTVNGATLLGDGTNRTLDCWTLDHSKFPPLSVVKVHQQVSGKGYAPRLKLISFSERPYELININWVFRTMYAR